MSVLISLDGSSGTALNDAKVLLRNVEGGLEKAVMRSINRSLTSGKTALTKGIRKTYTANREALSDAISVTRASMSRLEGSVNAKGKRQVPIGRRFVFRSTKVVVALSRLVLPGMVDGAPGSMRSTCEQARRSTRQRGVMRARSTRSKRSRRFLVRRSPRWAETRASAKAFRSAFRRFSRSV